MGQAAAVQVNNVGAAALARARAKAPTTRPLVEENLALVTSEARRLSRRLGGSVAAETLLGSGCVGLMAAARLFDPGRGVCFSAFARLKIRAAMLDELRDMDLLPRRARTALRKLERARSSYMALHGSEPSAEQLSAATDVPEEAVGRLMVMAQSARHEPLEAAERLCGSPPEALDQVARQQQHARLAEHISRLGARHQQLLAAYYQGDMTFKQIGVLWGVTESRVCQMHAEAVRELRRTL